jgi:hypothetical protein
MHRSSTNHRVTWPHADPVRHARWLAPIRVCWLGNNDVMRSVKLALDICATLAIHPSVNLLTHLRKTLDCLLHGRDGLPRSVRTGNRWLTLKCMLAEPWNTDLRGSVWKWCSLVCVANEFCFKLNQISRIYKEAWNLAEVLETQQILRNLWMYLDN